MTDIRQNLSDYVRDHPDAIVVTMAVVFLIVVTLAVVNFLWARRAALLRRELTAVRAAMTGFVAPTASAPEPPDPALVERDGRTLYSVATTARPEADVAGDPRPATPRSTPAQPARWKTPGPAPASSASWALGTSDEAPAETAPSPTPVSAWPALEPEAPPPPAIAGVDIAASDVAVAEPAPPAWPRALPAATPPAAASATVIAPPAAVWPPATSVQPAPAAAPWLSASAAAAPAVEPVAPDGETPVLPTVDESEPEQEAEPVPAAEAEAADVAVGLEPEPPVAEPEPTAAAIDATSSYAVWHAVTAGDEATTGAEPAVPEPAAASAYAAWGEVTTAEPPPSSPPEEFFAEDTEPAFDEPLPDYPELDASPVVPLDPPPPAPSVLAEPEAAVSPAVETAATAVTPPSDAATEGDAGPDILLVEDDENVGKVYRLLMESKGYGVRHAVDGLAGLELARAKRPDLILLDVMMPRMNGILFLQSLRAEAHLREVPVVILSNFREPRLVERALALGAIEYMVKAQTRPDAMLAAIPRWLRGERALTG